MIVIAGDGAGKYGAARPGNALHKSPADQGVNILRAGAKH